MNIKDKTIVTVLLRLNRLRNEEDIPEGHKAEITEIMNLLLNETSPQPDCPWK